ncbi:MAG: LPXTG cell wall anchor domain-containing protein [Mogibacterium sp.]|nr:LPXTG cell wall anchor domain-containing protein [Mogibacterium sp.]
MATATGTTDDPDNPNPTIVPGKTTVTTDVPEEPATGGKGVKTGDDNNIPGAIGGFFASLAALFGAVYVRRRKNSEE